MKAKKSLLQLRQGCARVQDTVGLFLLSLMKQNRSPKSTGSLAVTRLNSIKALMTVIIVHWHRATGLFVKTGFKGAFGVQ